MTPITPAAHRAAILGGLWLWVAGAGAGPGTARAQELRWQPVELPDYNHDFQDDIDDRYQGYAPRIPRGDVLLGGVPFRIPVEGNSCWNGYKQGGPDRRVLDIPVGIPNPRAIYTLINTWWGMAGPQHYAQLELEFDGSAADPLIIPLIGNVEIRDWNPSCWTNALDPARAVEVWNSGQGHRMDKQYFPIPIESWTRLLTHIRLVDDGLDEPWPAPDGRCGHFSQRILLSGLTVSHEATGFQRGNCDGKGDIPDITDAIFLLSYLFLGRQMPPCEEACDADASGESDLTDAIYLLSFLFLGGPKPPGNYPGCDLAPREACGTPACP